MYCCDAVITLLLSPLNFLNNLNECLKFDYLPDGILNLYISIQFFFCFICDVITFVIDFMSAWHAE